MDKFENNLPPYDASRDVRPVHISWLNEQLELKHAQWAAEIGAVLNQRLDALLGEGKHRGEA
jgi:hypothetical protein